MNRKLKYYIFRSLSEVYGLFASLNQGIRVLLYHKITADVAQEERITRQFELQLRKLKDRLVPDPIQAMETTLTKCNSGIIISFDDGYSEISQRLVQSLKKWLFPISFIFHQVY
ncbi:MAG: hypothetical protein L3J79_01440 [Candidatus Marinimicrobia bacterium]|nr:hypothetical protein [Candidatus Neomarinimicrobiota bacterium]